MLDHVNDVFQPYMKNNANPIYIHSNSNYHPSVNKHIPSFIEHRVCNNASDKDVFDKYSSVYNTALKNSGYKCAEIKYRKSDNIDLRKRNRIGKSFSTHLHLTN